MMHPLIAIMNGWATVFFLLAIVWGIYNTAHDLDVTPFWITYTTAAVFGMLFTATRAVQWAGVSTPYIDQLQSLFALMGGTILATSALICAMSSIERQVK